MLDRFGPSATLETLKLRAELLKRVRAFFDQRQFFEVETPVLSADTVIDRHLEPMGMAVDDHGNPSPGIPENRWLQTSPEFAMKRLVASSKPRGHPSDWLVDTSGFCATGRQERLAKLANRFKRPASHFEC